MCLVGLFFPSELFSSALANESTAALQGAAGGRAKFSLLTVGLTTGEREVVEGALPLELADLILDSGSSAVEPAL